MWFWVLSFCLSATKPYLVISTGIAFCCFNFQVTYPTTRQQASWSLDDLPRTVAITMHQGSTVTSMDFHPSHHTLLLGTVVSTWPILQLIAKFVTNRLQFHLFIFFLCLTCSFCWTVGSSNGEITLWEVSSRERLVSKPLKIWDAAVCSPAFQVSSLIF